MGDRTCSIGVGCSLTGELRRGWCIKHYNRWRFHGDPLYNPPPGRRFQRGSAVEDRFFSWVNASGVCWEWTASKDGDGYGQFHPRPGKRVGAHRWSYEFLVGPVPDGLELDHLCRNKSCVNPDHLEPTTKLVNNRRGGSLSAINRRKTRCIRGHMFTPENTYVRPSGSRNCRACYRLRDARRKR